MGRLAIIFGIGFVLAHAWAYFHARVTLGVFEATLGATPMLPMPPTTWYMAIALVELGVAAFAYVLVARHRYRLEHHALWAFGALIAGILTSYIGAGAVRPVPAFATGIAQVIADILFVGALGGLFAWLLTRAIAKWANTNASSQRVGAGRET